MRMVLSYTVERAIRWYGGDKWRGPLHTLTFQIDSTIHIRQLQGHHYEEEVNWRRGDLSERY